MEWLVQTIKMQNDSAMKLSIKRADEVSVVTYNGYIIKRALR